MVVDNVLCLVWQDNNLVLALSTVHYPTNIIERLRKRSKKTSTNAGIVSKIFGGDVTKKLPIPTFIDDYNHHMNGMDVANQMRASYTTHIVTERNWLPILYWLLDAAIVNAFRIQQIYYQQKQKINPIISHLDFHEKLYKKLFDFTSLAKQAHFLPIIRLDSQLNHSKIRLEKIGICIWCAYQRKQGQKDQTKQADCSYLNCSVCKVYLYLKTKCWEEFHSYQ